MKKGYSIAELVVATAIIGMMAALSVTSLSNYLKRESLSSAATALASAIREARTKTLASVRGQQYGVKIDSDRFTTFAGAAYSTSTADSPYLFPNNLRASTTIPSVVFLRVTGNTAASGTIDVYVFGSPSTKRSVTVQGTGLVNIF